MVKDHAISNTTKQNSLFYLWHPEMVTVHFVLLQLVLILFEGVGEGESEGGEDELKGDGL